MPMLKLPYIFFLYKQSRKLCQISIIASFAVANLMSGTVLCGAKANAQNPTPNPTQNSAINDTELVNYAKAILAMEPARQQAFDDIKKLIGNSEVPKIVCNDPNSFNVLPAKAKDIAVDYCNRSQKIVEANGLSINRFNKITVEVQASEPLQKKIYDQLMMLQKKPLPKP